jgi:sugar phosphate isomerase/epimerase
MKRNLLLTIILSIIIAPFFGLASAKPKKEIAVQLYSVRTLIGDVNKYASNHERVLKALADMGYTYVEAAGYDNGKLYGRTPAEFKNDVESAGLKILSSHCGRGLSENELATGDFSESMAWWKQCIQAHKAAGMKYIVDPWMGPQKTLKDLDTYCRYLNAIGKLCKENGISFGYHNHSYEFQKVEGQVMYDYILKHTDPQYVFFQMDLYWAVMGQAAPVDYFKQYAGRFRMFHVKDRMEVGQSGMVGFDAIYNNASTAGLEYSVVELEDSNMEILDGLKVSIDYLLHAPFVKSSYKK